MGRVMLAMAEVRRAVSLVVIWRAPPLCPPRSPSPWEPLCISPLKRGGERQRERGFCLVLGLGILAFGGMAMGRERRLGLVGW